MIIGTAGHIDHGKTSLVKALTGIDTDRLREEKRRGITIELGFAHLTLPDGTVAGVVDVPGHERFVKAMAAGAGGVDLAILVVAADEGVMPQTREHLDICRLLGVQSGVVAVTKADLLPGLGAGWLDLLKADLLSLVQGTFLEGAKVIPCSAQTGEGLVELKAALAACARGLPRRPSEGPVFLPVDRAFSMKGFGTVVTGSLLSGQLAVEDAVALLPGLEGPWRVRGLQVHGLAQSPVLAGQRIAVNLSGVDAERVRRGMALVKVQELPETRMLDVELSLLPAAERPLPKRSKLLLHLGTEQTEATVALLDRPFLAPGDTAFAQLRLAAPMVALPGLHFILRGSRALPGRGATLAGGKVVGLTPPKRRAAPTAHWQPLLSGDLETRLVWLLREAGYRGLSFAELFARSAVSVKVLTRSVELLGARGQALLVDKERRLYLSSEVFASLVARSRAELESFHAREPLKEGLSREELRQRLSPNLEPRTFGKVVGALLEQGTVEATGELVRIRGKGRALSQVQEGTRTEVVRELVSSGLAPPTVNELAAKTRLAAPRVVELLKTAAAEGQVLKVADDLYFAKEAVDGLKDKLIAHLKAHREISTQQFKEMVGQSRKFVIPLSEYFDREKVTLRVGEKRILRRG